MTVNSTSTAVSASRMPQRLFISARSASRPPTRLPATRPTPNSTSSHVTAPSEKPASSVIIGAMKVKAAKTPPKPSAVVASASHT